MKKTLILALTLALAFALSACGGVSKADLDAAVAQRVELQTQYDALKAEDDELRTQYNELKAEHDALVEATADWMKLSEDEKEAQLAQAEADRIAAEEAAKKAKEEQAAAQKAAAEEAKRKAEEAAAAKAEEEKRGYNTGITFNDLSRNPDDYEGKKVKFTGEVLQVSELKNEIQIRLATKPNSWGGYSDNVIYIYFDSGLISSRILEDDIITVYGVARGLHSYTTVLGANVTLPLIEVEKIDT